MKIRLPHWVATCFRYTCTAFGVLFLLVAFAPGVILIIWIPCLIAGLFFLHLGGSSLYRRVLVHPYMTTLQRVYGTPGMKLGAILTAFISCSISWYLAEDEWLKDVIALSLIATVLIVLLLRPLKKFPRI